MSVQGLMQTSFARNFFDKLNISHWFGEGRWADFVSDKIFDSAMQMLDFGYYIERELSVALSVGFSKLSSWFLGKSYNKIKGLW